MNCAKYLNTKQIKINFRLGIVPWLVFKFNPSPSLNERVVFINHTKTFNIIYFLTLFKVNLNFKKLIYFSTSKLFY